MTTRWKFGRSIFPGLLIVLSLAFLSPATAAAELMPPGIHSDIQYGQAAGESLLLDAFVPQSPGPHPVAILVHGGGWSSGNKQDMEFLFEPLSKADFTWFSINYRLAPKHRWPACLQDVRAAVKWVKSNAAAYKGDPDKIALVGYSAGGHLVSAAVTLPPNPSTVQAVVGLAAPTDLVADMQRRGGLSSALQHLFDKPQQLDEPTWKLLRLYSPVQYIHSALPPFLLVHGTQDTSVPYDQSISLQTALTKQGVACDLITLQGASHRIAEWPQFDQAFIPKTVQWLKQTLDNQARTMTVIPDGTGDFTTVQAAVDAVPENNTKPVIVHIQPGTYKEKIVVPRSKRFVTFKGQNDQMTVLTYDLYAGVKDENGKEIGTFRTPSVTIEADDFTAEQITFENTAGDVGQAVAVAVTGDRAVFRHCRFLGWQDTLLDNSGRHYYENCYIAGHCDFIFGGGTAFFERCQIHCLQASYITAASTPEHQPYGYVFSHCTITGEPENSRTYFGRPWRDYASVVFLNTEMSAVVRPAGWHNWDKPHREQTSRYAEYNSTGPGAAPQARVNWSRQLTQAEAEKITVQTVLSGSDGWNPLINSVGHPSCPESFKAMH